MFRRRLLRLGLIAAIALIARGLLPGHPARAHPADMYFHTHAITLTARGAQVTWTFAPGTLLSYATWNAADTDRDDEISPAEAQAWAEARSRSFRAFVDGAPVDWFSVTVDWPPSLIEFETGAAPVLIHLALVWPEGFSGAGQIAFYNQFEEFTSSNWFTVTAEAGVWFAAPQQDNGALTFRLGPGDPLADAAAPSALAYWDSGTPAIGASGARVTPPARPSENSPAARLTRLVREGDLSLSFILTALGIAIGLGSLHALTPGHGKALVGAYLVGSRGTLRHAVALGGIVTVTHTGSVLALGLITLAASHILLPTTLFPLLEMASGLLIVALGLALIGRRWRAWQSVRRARRQRESAPPQPTARPSSPAGATTLRPATASATIAIHQPIQVNVYNAVLPQEGATLTGIKWRALVTLGISGGLVPCPDAIAILLVAVAINRVVLGLSLIVAFSLGLAAVLTAIGIAMVRSRRLFERLDRLNRVVPAMPLISAVIVTALGLFLAANAAARSELLRSGREGSRTLEFAPGSATPAPQDSSAGAAFDLARAQVLYLDTDAANLYQIFRIPAQGGAPRPLTDEPFGVWDFALAPDGRSVAYATPRELGGSDVWLLDLAEGGKRRLLTCEAAACSRLVWSPDGARLVHEKLEISSTLSPLGVTTLWWLDLAAGTNGPVFRDSQLPSFNPSWSPDGQWLAYVAPGTAAIQVHNLRDGRTITLPSQTGSAAVWSPDSRALLMTDVSAQGNQQFTHLLRTDLASGAFSDLTTLPDSGDTWAAWSPDGAWIAVVRRIYDGPGAALGDQLWLMRPDGSDARALTDTPDVVHGPPVWSPDSRALLFQRYDLSGTGQAGGIWWLEVETCALRQIASTGTWPAWLP